MKKFTVCYIVAVLILFSVVICSCRSTEPLSSQISATPLTPASTQFEEPSQVVNRNIDGIDAFTGLSGYGEPFTSNDQLLTTDVSGNIVSVDPTSRVFYCDASGSSCYQPSTLKTLSVSGTSSLSGAVTMSSTLTTAGVISTTSGYAINGYTMAYGLFGISANSYASTGAYLNLTSGLFSNNCSVSGQVLTLVNPGIYKIELFLNYATGYNGKANIVLRYSSTSTGTYSDYLNYANYESAGNTDTTMVYQFLIQAKSSSLYWKLYYWGDNSLTPDAGGSTEYWSRLHVWQIA